MVCDYLEHMVAYECCRFQRGAGELGNYDGVDKNTILDLGFGNRKCNRVLSAFGFRHFNLVGCICLLYLLCFPVNLCLNN